MIDRNATGLAFAVPLIDMTCRLAGPLDFINDGRRALSRHGVLGAVRRHDTATIFDWLMTVLSMQGIADRVATGYIRDHGNATWAAIRRDLSRKPSCGKLHGFWAFDDCRYQKGHGTCSRPSHLPACPLPRHDLRNGRLNQSAFGLALFMRDIALGDFVNWMDDQLGATGPAVDAGGLAVKREALIGPLRGVFGVSDKVISMAMSSLLLSAGRRRPLWFDVGASFVVVDTLVHNFLHRTGILAKFGADHPYGAACYRPNGCAALVERIAQAIDARAFNPDFPQTFPRFVQLAIWRYCSESGLDICNGNRIDDRQRCQNDHCQLYPRCSRCSKIRI